ncbi:hypothetical protein TRAPUB_8791 [Trametes pubescens]|uniref:Major facilitator superfamily (MFS) profile domain-containing protein n=1 Tax=Trametes pubescens TaxID=154538 RepID=A0A1M2W7Z7_TRAPU|nr:hypothetical protein TRAPUB_8791 [Trametes pubescens]
MDTHNDIQASGSLDLQRAESVKSKQDFDVEAKILSVSSHDSHDIYDGDDSTVDPVYRAKIMLINDAFQEIGMGKYQIAWPLISNFSCASAADCPRASNQGWRYFLYTVGGLVMVLFILRFFVFHLYESPRYLVGRGRDAEAVDVLHKVAAYNGKESRLTFEMLAAAGEAARRKSGESASVIEVQDEKEVGAVKAGLAASRQIFSGKHVKALFATRKLALSTTLLIWMWALIGLAFALYNNYIPYFLQTRGADFGDGSVYITYRNQVILSVVGIPGAFLAGWMVERPYLGRNGTLAISTILTGAFLLASTTARSSDALLGWNCGYSLTNNVMWGVLFAVTPELFPAKDRGTGNAVVELGDRFFNLFAPVIALYADLTTSVPIWLSGALFIVAGFSAFLLPFEPRGKASI